MYQQRKRFRIWKLLRSSHLLSQFGLNWLPFGHVDQYKSITFKLAHLYINLWKHNNPFLGGLGERQLSSRNSSLLKGAHLKHMAQSFRWTLGAVANVVACMDVSTNDFPPCSTMFRQNSCLFTPTLHFPSKDNYVCSLCSQDLDGSIW